VINPDRDPISAIPIFGILILAIVTPFWHDEERGENFTIVIEYNRMIGWCFNDHDVLNNGFQWLTCQSGDAYPRPLVITSSGDRMEDMVRSTTRKFVGLQGQRSRKVVKWFAARRHRRPITMVMC
jgi:hypothetical protein